jgi:hypothetical protein
MNVFIINAPIDSLLVNGEACVSCIHPSQDLRLFLFEISLVFFPSQKQVSASTVDLLLS